MARRGPRPTIRVSAHFDNEGSSARLHDPVTIEQMRNIIDRAERRQLTEFEVVRLRSGMNRIEDGERIIRELTTRNSQLQARGRKLINLFHEMQSLTDFWEEREHLTSVEMTIAGIRRFVGVALRLKDSE